MFTKVRLRFLIATAVLALSAEAGAQMSAVYDNGSPNLLNGFEITHWKQANSFTLTASVVLARVLFWDVEASSSFQSQAYWEIRRDNAGSPGTVIFSGTSTDLTHIATGRRAFVYPEFVNNFGLPSVSLTAGNYWLVLHNGPLSNNVTRDIFWETTTSTNLAVSMSDTAPFANNWQTDGAVSQMAFQLIGVLESVRPRITSISAGAGRTPRITFTTISGQNYRVEYSNSLVQPLWLAVPGAQSVQGTGNEIQINDPDPGIASVKQRFYRVVML